MSEAAIAKKAEVVKQTVELINNAESAIVVDYRGLTVAEVSAAGLPAVFIPLPTAVDDHQTKNAMTMVNAGASKIIAQQDLNEESLKAAIEPLLNDRSLLDKMASNARAQASLHATDEVVAVIDSLVK